MLLGVEEEEEAERERREQSEAAHKRRSTPPRAASQPLQVGRLFGNGKSSTEAILKMVSHTHESLTQTGSTF